MFETFTERAGRIMFFAQEEVAQRRHNAVAAEHILLAALREKDTVCCHILKRIGVSIKNLHREVDAHIAGSEQPPGSEIALADSAQRVIDYADAEANQLANAYIGTEHLLLGLIREGLDNGGELTGRALRDAGVDLERVRSEVLALQDNDSGVRSPKQNGSPSPSSASPPLAERAFAASQIAATMFEREFQKLSPEQQATLQTNGLPAGQLSSVMREMIRFAARPAQPESSDNVQMIRNPDGLLRVQIEPLNAGTRYSVVSSVTLVTTMLVRDDA